MKISGQLLFLLAISALLTAHVAAIPLTQFYPFGKEAGDILLPRNDDGSSDAVLLSPQFTFFGQQFDNIYVNNNGHLSPGVPYSQYIPQQLPFDIPLIAVFWGDVDTRPPNGGFVWYRNTTSEDLLQQALNDIRGAYPLATDINYLFIATWDHVGYHNLRTDKTNTFQCVLARSGNQTYAIYLYADELIQWIATSGRVGALGGYNAGDSVISFTIPGSRTDDIINISSTSNVGVPGIWVFRLDKDVSVLPTCVENSHEITCSARGIYEVEITCEGIEPQTSLQCSFSGGPLLLCTLPLVLNRDVSPPGNHSVRIVGCSGAEDTVTYHINSSAEPTVSAKVPPLGVYLINESPRLTADSVEAEFQITRPVAGVRCFLRSQFDRVWQNCSSGHTLYPLLRLGLYVLKVHAYNSKTDVATVKRGFVVDSDPTYCSLVLVNRGVTLREDGTSAEVEFKVYGSATQLSCVLDGGVAFTCMSPVELSGLNGGRHNLEITPLGCSGGSKSLSVQFTTI